MKETDPDRSDELCAEIWRVLRERDEVRKALRIESRDAWRNLAIARIDLAAGIWVQSRFFASHSLENPGKPLGSGAVWNL